MNAELVFVGTELLLGEILNTNARYLSEQLAELGIDVYFQQTVGDNAERVAAVLRQALSRSDIVITSGGLGPTMDDLTREVAAAVTGRPLAPDPDLLLGLERWFRGRGRLMTENNKRQALVPAGATVLKNDRGTAPGLIIHADGGKAVILLPGPPFELEPMFERQVAPYLATRIGATPRQLVSRTLRFVDVGESTLEDRLKDLIALQQDPSIAPYAKMSEVHLRLATKAPDAETGRARIAPVEAEIRHRLGDHIYGVDETTLEAAVGGLLKSRGLKVATAESCTGGLVAKRLTDVPGSSAYFGYGYVSYSYEAKTDLLGVEQSLLQAEGAVSEPVVRAMAQGALARSGADVAVAISGIAGPDGGTPEKPVGTVWFALAASGRSAQMPVRPGAAPAESCEPRAIADAGLPALPAGVWTRCAQFWGSREDVRERSAVFALAMVRRYLLSQPL